MANHHPSYMPVRENDFIKWYQEFLATLQLVYMQVGLAEEEVTELETQYTALIESEKAVTRLESLLHSYVAAKNTLLSGEEGASVVFETLPMMAGSTITGGIKDRIVRVVALITASPGYTEAIGRDLGIVVGPKPPPDWSGKFPLLKAAVIGSTRVQVTWHKQGADGVYLEVNRGSGWQIIGNITGASHEDLAPFPQALTEWKYRATYIVKNRTVGEVGPEAAIFVQAKPE
ncbi:hypothetical protein OPIT5_18800 [Opitutaceae bacterium TAV5]|nr:hypothetical protein OPIT5_18800 [Opitutaceae bacterium TAV5]